VARGLSLLRAALLVGKVAVVLYMLYVTRANRRERQTAAAMSTAT